MNGPLSACRALFARVDDGSGIIPLAKVGAILLALERAFDTPELQKIVVKLSTAEAGALDFLGLCEVVCYMMKGAPHTSPSLSLMDRAGESTTVRLEDVAALQLKSLYAAHPALDDQACVQQALTLCAQPACVPAKPRAGNPAQPAAMCPQPASLCPCASAGVLARVRLRVCAAQRRLWRRARLGAHPPAGWLLTTPAYVDARRGRPCSRRATLAGYHPLVHRCVDRMGPPCHMYTHAYLQAGFRIQARDWLHRDVGAITSQHGSGSWQVSRM